MLVADAHFAPTAPAQVHFAHLRAGDFDVTGSMLPGIPLVWTGMNRDVAWASTHARAVTTDLYEETLHADREGSYHDGRGWKKLRERVAEMVGNGRFSSVAPV